MKIADLEPGVTENESSSQVVHYGFAGDKQGSSSRQNFNNIVPVMLFSHYKSSSPIIAKILSLIENRCLICYDIAPAPSFSGVSVETSIPRTKIKEQSKIKYFFFFFFFLDS